MANNINVRQNEQQSLDRIAAFRQKYSDVKWLIGINWFLSVFMVLLLYFASIFLSSDFFQRVFDTPSIDITNSVRVYSFVTFIVEFFIANAIRNGKATAAAIQELFDCYTYGLPWNSVIAPNRPLPEHVYRLKKLYLKHNGNLDDLKNWYNPMVASTDPEKGILLCQRMNLNWDKELRGGVVAYSFFIIVAAVLLNAIFVIMQDQTLLTFIANIVIFLPLIKFYRDVIVDNRNSIANLDLFRATLNTIWTKAKNAQAGILQDVRELQNIIFLHRNSSRPVPNWYYRFRKEAFEDEAGHSIEQMIRELE